MTRPLIIVFVVVLLALTGMTVWLTRGAESERLGDLAPAAGDAPKVNIGGAFQLIDQNGKTVKNTDFRGKLMLVFFGYTHCPDICPVTLATFTSVMTKLGAKAGQVVPVFITVDPVRDTPPVMKAYLANFSPAIVGLTGTEAEVSKAAAAYKVYAAEPEEHHHHHGGEDYAVDHSGIAYLMGRDGAYLAHFSPGDSEDAMLKTIEAHLQ